MMTKRHLSRLAVGVLSAALFNVAGAQTFPSKTVSIMVPYPPGGGSDFSARTIQPEYQKQLGQTVIVENLGGAGGALGVQKVLSAQADGYAQILGSPIELVLPPLALSAVKYKPEDVRLIGLVAVTDLALMVRKDIPANTVEEFIAWGKGKQLSYGSTGQGSLYHIMGARFAALTGLDMLHVPYKGIAPLMTDLTGNQVDAAFLPFAGPIPGMLKDGRFKALGTASPRTNAAFPDVPSLTKNKMLNDFSFDIWVGVQVPKATPDAVVKVLHQALGEVVKAPDVRKGIASTGATVPAPMGLAELDAFYSKEVERYRSFFKSARIEPQ